MLDNIIDKVFQDYALILVNKYNYDKNVLFLEWKSSWNNFTFSKNIVNDDENDDEHKSIKQTSTCPYKLTRGINSNTICNGKLKDGHLVCSKHLKYEIQFKNVNSNTVKIIKQRTKIKTNAVNTENSDNLDKDIINTCTSDNETETVNIDGLQVYEINNLYKKLFNEDGIDYFKKRDLTIQEIFFEKRKRLLMN